MKEAIEDLVNTYKNKIVVLNGMLRETVVPENKNRYTAKRSMCQQIVEDLERLLEDEQDKAELGEV